jgi:tripartite ATP-independent transporter DctP family solute receptor
MEKRTWILQFALIAVWIAFAVHSIDAAPIVLKLGGLSGPGHPDTLANERMTKLVDERSDGRLKIEFFPAAQLGSGITQIEGVMMGTQDMFSEAAEFWGQFEKDYNILALPFAFRDQEHLQAFFNSPLHSNLKEQLRKSRGVRIIAHNWSRPPRVLLSKKPVYSPKDLTGIKMRVPEIEIYLRVWKAMGTRPTQVPWAETYLALMQGVVDAMECVFTSINSGKFYEAAPNISLTNHLISAGTVCINDKKFLSLTKDLQDILVEAAKDTGDYLNKIIIDTYSKDMKEMESKGAKFIVVDQKPFQEKIKPLITELEKEGKWSKGLYQKVQNIK